MKEEKRMLAAFSCLVWGAVVAVVAVRFVKANADGLIFEGHEQVINPAEAVERVCSTKPRMLENLATFISKPGQVDPSLSFFGMPIAYAYNNPRYRAFATELLQHCDLSMKHQVSNATTLFQSAKDVVKDIGDLSMATMTLCCSKK